MNVENRRITCAVDIGGTKTLVGLVAEDGEMIVKKRFVTEIARDPYVHLNQCIQLLRACAEECGLSDQSITGIGIAAPGLVDSKNGILIKAPYAGWTNARIRDYFSSVFVGKRVMMANDANACALGELMFGEGKKYRNYVWVTISTGIGAGIMIDGKLFEGENGISGEVGHTVVEWDHGRPCSCGNKGCFEAHASGHAIASIAAEKCSEDNASQLKKYLLDNNLGITAESVAIAAREGVTQAKEIFDAVSVYAGRAFSYLVNLIDPGCIFVGGGVGLSFDLLQPGIRRVLQNMKLAEANRNVPIVPTKLGYDASFLGAASLVWRAIG